MTKADKTDRTSNRNTWLLGLLLAAATIIAYYPAAKAGYIWDDDGYLTKNPLLTDFAGFIKLWIPGNTPQYYPAVFSSFWIENHLWGLRPMGYHVVNMIFHVLNALLVWRLCRQLRIPGAWFIGAVFALHPVHVESVAWITERKNVMSGFFYLTAAWAYLRFSKQTESPPSCNASPATKHGKKTNKKTKRSEVTAEPKAPRTRTWYALSLTLFILALLAKSVTCSMPAALILIMLWQRKSLTFKWCMPLLPFFIIGLLLALHTAHIERTQVGATGEDFDFSFAERTLIAGNALLFYPQKLIVPWPLIFFYPRWDLDASNPLSFWPVAVVAIAIVTLIITFSRGRRGAPLALAYFAGTLFPALGFFNVYPMRFSFVADHFQYLASLGFIILVVGSVTELAPKLAWTEKRPKAIRIAGAVILVIFAVLTWNQCHIYKDEETLWRSTIERNPEAWIAYNNLAEQLAARGDHEEALDLLKAALPLTKSGKAADQIELNMAISLEQMGRLDEALEKYEQLQNRKGGMELRLARTLERLGRDEEAETFYTQALEGETRIEALVPYGLSLLRKGRPEEAIDPLEAFIESYPEATDVRMFLADALAGANRMPDAIRVAEQAIELARRQGKNRMADQIRNRIGQYHAGEPTKH